MSGFFFTLLRQLVTPEDELPFHQISIEELKTTFKQIFFQVYTLQNFPICDEDQSPLDEARKLLATLRQVAKSRKPEMNPLDFAELGLLYTNANKLLRFDPERALLPLTRDTEFQEVLTKLGYQPPSAKQN